MFYQVRATLFFTIRDEAVDFFHDCEVALPKATVINPNTPEEECSTIDLIECHHDEMPHYPCIIIEHKNNHTT